MRKLTTEEFVARAHEIHGDCYDYSLVKYEGTNTKVQIICPTHGLFEQTPSNHLLGHGCPWCVKVQRTVTTSDFIARARDVHGDRYDYSLVEYKNWRSPVKITCPEHGVFEQIPNNHLKGRGCSHCALLEKQKRFALTNKEFVKHARDVHGDRYDYSLVEYKNARTPVKITCPEHGVFEQTPDKHKQRHGCPKCAQNGFNPAKHAVLYVLADDQHFPLFLKIGITNDFKKRLIQLRRETPHPVEKLAVYPFPIGSDAYKLEQEIHEVFRELNAGMSGFNGATEWFKYSPAILDYIRSCV